MISRIKFKDRVNLDTVLTHYDGIYAVDSELNNTIKYAVSDEKFAILMPIGAVFCPLHETPKLAVRLKDDVREEVMGIWEDIRSMGLERTW